MKYVLGLVPLVLALATYVSADDSPAFKVIEVQQTGGFAGVNITYRITPDGKFTRKSRQGTAEGRLEAKALNQRRHTQQNGPAMAVLGSQSLRVSSISLTLNSKDSKSLAARKTGSSTADAAPVRHACRIRSNGLV